MNTAVNAFVTESNVALYLSKAYTCLDARQRDTLLRLLVEDEGRMGSSREHMENGERRLEECKERMKRHRELMGSLPSNESRAQAEFMLETFERALVLMERHQRLLIHHFQKNRL